MNFIACISITYFYHHRSIPHTCFYKFWLLMHLRTCTQVRDWSIKQKISKKPQGSFRNFDDICNCSQFFELIPSLRACLRLIKPPKLFENFKYYMWSRLFFIGRMFLLGFVKKYCKFSGLTNLFVFLKIEIFQKKKLKIRVFKK